MMEFAAVAYGLMLSFVLSSLHLNQKYRRPNPRIMVAIGYFLVGATAALSVALLGYAVIELL
ncbi:MAG TPA: hypothetical protein VFX27_10495 [Sphingobium sp.]|nr:hypothetical protein [Sphingobium sp.]